MSKKSRLRRPFHKHHVKHPEPRLKSTWHYLYHIHWSVPSQLSWKKYLLLTWEILRLLVNIVVFDEKYPVLKKDNLTIPIQMHLRQKRKKISQFFATFLKCSWNFEQFDKKDDAHRFCNFEITDSENVVRWISKKPRLRELFDKQHGKCAKPLLKSPSQHLHHIDRSLPSQLSWKKSLFLTG